MADAKLAGIYSPLDPLEGEIRLIHLQPYPSGLRVTCSLHVARLVDVAGQYEALSYEWGPPISEMETISIEEKFFAVRPNLYLALEHLRLQSDIRVLWIDALCIDQADEKERNHQVQHMGSIYSSASRVIAWLGLPQFSPSISGAKQSSDHVQEALEFAALFHGHTKRYSYNYFKRRWAMSQGSPTSPTIEFDDPRWAMLFALLDRSYWRRLWIFQELVLASAILVQVGNYVVDFDSLEQILAEQVHIPNAMLGGIQIEDFARTSAFTISQQRLQRRSTKFEQHSILDLCFRYREAGCVDVRDKIFALRAMSKNCCQQAINVDYSISPVDLCHMVIEHHLRGHHNHGLHADGFEEGRALMVCIRTLLTLFQGDDDRPADPSDEDSPGILFAASSFFDQPVVAMLQTCRVGNVTSLVAPSQTGEDVHLANVWIDDIDKSHMSFYLTSIAVPARKGDMVHKVSSSEVIILRHSDQNRNLQLIANGWLAYCTAGSYKPVHLTESLYMDMVTLKNFCLFSTPKTRYRLIPRYCLACDTCVSD